jgi:hypothetical protein
MSSPPAAASLEDDLLCGGCGQNLRGVAADRCPECGRRFDRARLISPDVPWEVRRHVGRVRAFFATVWTVTRRPGRLVTGSVTLRGARRFRAVVVAILFVCSVAAAMTDEDLRGERGLFAVSAVAWLVSLGVVTGAGSLFFAPRHLSPDAQRRTVAVSLYTSALLLWGVPLGALLAWIGLRDGWIYPPWLHQSMWVTFGLPAAALLMVAWLLVMWIVPCRLLYALTGSRRRVALYALLCPMICLLAPVVIEVAFNALVTFMVILRARW